MKNQPVFVRILIPQRVDRVLSEKTFRSMRIVLKVNDVVYYVLDNIIYYIDDG